MTWFRYLSFSILLILPVEFSFANIHKIEQDYISGKITYVERVTYLGYRVFAPDKLPSQYQKDSDLPIKCATGIVAEIRNALERMSPENREFFATVLERPDYPNQYISPSGRFKLHYTETGTDAVSTVDSDQSGISDYIEEAARIFDYCYQVEVDSLGYSPPPADEGIDGLEIDIYFKNIFSAYAYTYFEKEVSGTPYKDWITYLVLDNDFQGNFFTKGIEALKVTFAHEFFHMIQGAYFIDFVNGDFKDRFFYEMASTWMEERVFDEINDYYQYLPYFFSHTTYPLSYWNNIFEYGASIFLVFIQQKYDQDIIKRTWEIVRDRYDEPNFNSIKALDEAFSEFQLHFSDALINFGIWNYFTGSRSTRFKYFEEAEDYPMLKLDEAKSFTVDTTISDTAYALTLNYHPLLLATSSNLMLKQSHADNFWRSGIIINRGEPEIISEIPSQQIQNIGVINSFEDFVLVSANTNVPEATSDYLSDYTKNISMYNISQTAIAGEQRVFPNPYLAGQHQIIKVNTSIPASDDLQCSILSENGRVIYQYHIGPVNAGKALLQIPWDGVESSGKAVGSGVYICLISGGEVKIPLKFVFIRQ